MGVKGDGGCIKELYMFRRPGVLLFDSDEEFFDCPFCGTKFSAVDFHGDEILDQAKDCLKKRAFDAAKDKYQFVSIMIPLTLMRFWV